METKEKSGKMYKMDRVRGNKTLAATVLVLIMAMALAFPAFESATAQTPKKSTYAFIGATPNPIGVNQQTLLYIGIPDAIGYAGDGWTGLTVTVTQPDNKTKTLGPYKTDSTGGTGFIFTPTKAGTYFLVTNFPEQTYRNTIYAASTSTPLALNVTEQPIEFYPGTSLPTEYWTRPINAQFREWHTIAGNWLVPTPTLPTDNLYAPNNDYAPESAHILWTRPIGDTDGGLVGGNINTGYGIGDAYEGKYGGIIISGVLYYNKFESSEPTQQVVAVDLHTGKEMWTKTLLNNMRVSFGQVLSIYSMNYQGAFSYLWATTGSTWCAFEPFSGEWRYNMTNVPSGTSYYGPSGEILRYSVNSAKGYMTQWNSSAVVLAGKAGMAVAWGSQIKANYTYPFDANKGFDLNVSIPTGLPGSVRTIAPLDRVIGAEITTTSVTIWALSLKKGQEGTLLYKTTWQAPSEWAAGNQTISWGVGSLTDNVAVLYSKEQNNYYAFSLKDGSFLWGPSPSELFLNMFDRISTINYGVLVASGMGGQITGYNATTGEVMWVYEAEDPYTEFLMGNNWWMQQLFIADGKVYLGHVEHSPNQPLPRGAPFICLDIFTGKEVWKMTGGFRQTCWGGKAMIADSVAVFQDTYDQRIYAIGKGPSATTAESPLTAITKGSSVIIQGRVTDVSPGTEDYALRARFPNGVPAVSDQSQSDWMGYAYMQKEHPANATGVTVTLSVLDPNGDTYSIGEAITDASGAYSFMWQPDKVGKYTVYATFQGTKSYYGSSAETAVGVVEAPQTNPTATPAPTTAAPTTAAPTTAAPTTTAPEPKAGTDTVLYAGIAAVVLIVVVAAIAVFLRKRK
jgi:hypothetical protein